MGKYSRERSDRDQVSAPSEENDHSWVMWYCDTGQKANEYPDNTWMVVYDDKERKVNTTNSQYYR